MEEPGTRANRMHGMCESVKELAYRHNVIANKKIRNLFFRL